MLFPAAAIDGLVHQLGGLRLRAECSLVAAHPHAHLYDNQQTNTRNDNATTIPTSAAIHQEVNNKNNKSNDSDALNIANDSVSNGKAKCPVGMAIATSPGGEELQLEYNRIIHTVPPFYNFPPSMTKELMQLLLKLDNRDDNIIGMVDEGVHHDTTKLPSSSWSEKLLRSCYRQSFELAFANSNGEKTGEHRGTLFDTVLSSLCLLITPSSSSIPSSESRRVAVPLLGAGCRGFPTEVALHVAAVESVAWLLSSGSCYHEGNIMADSSVRNDTSEQDNDNLDEMVIAFGLLEKDNAESLASKIGESLASITCNRSQ